LLFVGCAHQLQFRVVDASSANGLADVNVKIQKGSSFSYFYRSPHEHTIGRTNTNGFITVSGVSSKDEVFFDMQGYYGASAGFVAHGRVGYMPGKPLDPDTAWRAQKVVESDKLIIIPLSPKQ
jgi:hypothetical protein